MRVLFLCFALLGTIWASELDLNTKDIQKIVADAKDDFDDSDIEFHNDKIIAISDVDNVSGFNVDEVLLMRYFLSKILYPTGFRLTK